MKISTYMLRYKYNNRANSTLNVLNYSKRYISVKKNSARRYDSAVYAVVMCPSVRPSVISRHCIKTTGRIELHFGMGASFHPSHK